MCVPPLQLFERLPSYRSLKQQADWLKERISLLLGGIQVVHVERLGPLLAIEEHYSTLNAFHKRLLPRRLALHPRSLQGLVMTLERCCPHHTHTLYTPLSPQHLNTGIFLLCLGLCKAFQNI